MYAEELKFTCEYNDFQMNVLENSEDYGKGLKVKVYDSRIEMWVTYIDPDEEVAYQCDIKNDSDCYNDLMLWGMQAFDFSLTGTDPEKFYENGPPLPYCHK